MTRNSSSDGVGLPDFFSHSVFVPADARQQVADQLSAVISEAAAYTARFGGGAVDLVIAGSIARGEPAVRWNGSRYALASDIDFVAIADDPFDRQSFERGIVERAGAVDPTIVTTCFTVRRARLPQVRSYFGADLVLGLDHRPVRSARLVCDWPPLRRREALEVVVHQLANYLLVQEPAGSTGQSERSGAEHKIRKLLLEALQAVTQRPGQRVKRYRELTGAPALKTLGSTLSAERIRHLVRGRDLSTKLMMSSGEAEQTVGALLARFLCPGAGEQAPAVLPTALTRLSDGRSDVLTIFQFALISWFQLAKAQPYEQEYAVILLRLWRQLDSAGLEHARHDQALLASLDAQELAQGAAEALRLMERAMCSLRLDYYRLLGPRNFGEESSHAYQELDLADGGPRAR
ncbi:hypothetical protein [Streptomyces sp. NPDC047042]|uniref:hypothetical protein n=1 Tax=Streptomyces sp. NPDC047042 TaxID=3154807 RepID=UPI0033D839FE